MSAPRRGRPHKRASSSRTFLWLLGFLVLAVLAGWAFGGEVIGDRIVVIEVNDNPNLEHGVEDQADKDAVWDQVIRWFVRRLETR